MNYFRNPVNNKYIVKALFIEYNLDLHDCDPMYTLRDEDYKGYPSLYRLYMEESDPTEYTFAKKHLDGWKHWMEICECEWFKPHVQSWRDELQVKLKSEALAEVLLEARTNPKAKLAANKFLLEDSWNKQPVGRPSKEKIKQEAQKIFSQSMLYDHEKELLNLPEDSLRIRN